MKISMKGFAGIIVCFFIFLSKMTFAAYAIKFVNNYALPVQTSQGNTINPKETWWTNRNVGTIYFTIPGYGQVIFQDIDQKHIPGDSIETLGILVTYHGSEVVARYPVMDAQLEATINSYGSLRLVPITPMTISDVIIDRIVHYN